MGVFNFEHVTDVNMVGYAMVVERPKAKSVVWKHFGFPADSAGTVLNHKKVVCRVCKGVIPFSRNTSNL
jgi:hypothetical protein